MKKKLKKGMPQGGKEAHEKDQKLSAKEQSELKRLEGIVDEHKSAFIKKASALTAIQKDRLYREKYKKLEEYCEKRFDISRAYAYKLISAGKLCEELKASDAPTIANENQARVLAEVTSKEDRAKVMKEAQNLAGEGAEIRTQSIKDAIEKIAPPLRPKSSSKSVSATKQINPKTVTKWLRRITLLHTRLVEKNIDREDQIAELGALIGAIKAEMETGNEVVEKNDGSDVATESKEESRVIEMPPESGASTLAA